MNLFNIVVLTLILFFLDSNNIVTGYGDACNGVDCVISPLPVCPLNGVYSEQENGCIITEPIIKNCPEGFKSSGVQCSKNVHTEKILTCPENTKYNKINRECYIEKREVPKCKPGYIEDGDGNCYRLNDAEIKCDINEDEKEDGCYSYKMVSKEYNCDYIPENIKSIHKVDVNSYISSTAYLEGESKYNDNGLMNSICKVKVFHKPSCPTNSTENKSTGECLNETNPEIYCEDDSYTLIDSENNEKVQVINDFNGSGIMGIKSRHYCEKKEYVEAITECPDGMTKEKDDTGKEVCLLFKNEIPKICPIGFTYNDNTKNCVYKEDPNIICNKGYVYRNGYCYLIEKEVSVEPEKSSPISFCADPEAAIIGQYCVNNQNLAPNKNCPDKYDYSKYSDKCEMEIEIEPIQTCPPRYILNVENQICERRIEKDCSTVKYRKHCTSYNGDINVDNDRMEVSLNRNLGTYHHSHGHGHGHHAETLIPASHGTNQIVHQCVEIPEHIQKTCVNTETAPIIYLCHDGIKTTEKRRCIKKNQVMPILSCPKEFKLRNGECVQQKIDSIKYKCPEGFNLTYNENSKWMLPYCISQIANTLQESKQEKMDALYECASESMTLSINEYNKRECIEIRSPECRHIGCKYLIKSLDPKWICPPGSYMSDEYLEKIKTTYNHRKLLANNSFNHNHNYKHNHHLMDGSLIYNANNMPKCIIDVIRDVSIRCANNSILGENGKCMEKVEKTCPSGGCESTLKFNPAVMCPKNTESQGSHNADLCKMTVKKPFKYYCEQGGKIVMHNKCRYIESKTCKNPGCVEHIKVEGKMQCPPGYSETRHVTSNYLNNMSVGASEMNNINLLASQGIGKSGKMGGTLSSSVSNLSSLAIPTSSVPSQSPSFYTNKVVPSNYSYNNSLGALANRRRLFGTVRPLSNSNQCTALEFTPYILSCRQGFTETDGKCLGVVDATYQCPDGSLLRQDGLCEKIKNGSISNSNNNLQYGYNTRKNV
ncbi:oocyst wall 3 [Cryptosporidium bovis]|uniref:oocyst wall 3 n=1 Tax=Cryptosporidium bovis TaxID=310047 RepID=UPI00351A95B8|nr:oocyst wall 3 [Cryptosporidium bovis]